LLTLAACDGPKHELGPVVHPAALEAMRTLPDGIALHKQVIERSCSPAGGVCHNSKEYPDLHTPGNLLAVLDKPCNEDKLDEPEHVFDGCEPVADEIVIGDFRTRIASIGIEEYDPVTGSNYRRLQLEKPAPRTFDREPARILRGEQALAELPASVVISIGERVAFMRDLYMLEYQSYLALNRVKGGDPNGNGSFGASKPWMMVAPGHPSSSYLLGRITGTVPGSRMPLANKPLTDAEYVGIVCWIETLGPDPKPSDRIDYDACDFARNPLSYHDAE
jgi:hypothetical protein